MLCRRAFTFVKFGMPGALALMVAGCSAVDNDSMSSLMVSPGKYSLYRCNELAEQGKTRVERVQELEVLMEKAAQGPGGEVANALAYRSEYLTARGELKELEVAAIEKKCDMPWRSVSDRSMW